MSKQGIPCLGSPRSKVSAVLKMIAERKGGKKKKKPTLKTIASTVGVASPSTVMNWKLKDMQEEAVAYRLSKRGWNKKLTTEEEEVVAGWIIWKRQKSKLVTAKHIISFLKRAFDVHVSVTWVSNMVKRNHLSSRRTQAVDVRHRKKEMQSEMINFLKQVQSLEKRDDQIVTIDEVSVWSDGVVLRSYAPKGGYVYKVIIQTIFEFFFLQSKLIFILNILEEISEFLLGFMIEKT